MSCKQNIKFLSEYKASFPKLSENLNSVPKKSVSIPKKPKENEFAQKYKTEICRN